MRSKPPRVLRIRPRRPASSQPTLPKRRLTALIEEAIIDAYDESEQRVGFLCLLQEHLVIPFTTELLGMPIRVERVDLDDAGEIVAFCRRGPHRQKMAILDLPLPSPPPEGWEWIAAYRHWARGWR
jgi:hypothetical protein